MSAGEVGRENRASPTSTIPQRSISCRTDTSFRYRCRPFRTPDFAKINWAFLSSRPTNTVTEMVVGFARPPADRPRFSAFWWRFHCPPYGSVLVQRFSTTQSGGGIGKSAHPNGAFKFAGPAHQDTRSIISPVMSTPITVPVGPTCFAARKQSKGIAPPGRKRTVTM